MHHCPRGCSPTEAEGRSYCGSRSDAAGDAASCRQAFSPVVGRRKVAAPERKRRGLSRRASEKLAYLHHEAHPMTEVDTSSDGGTLTEISGCHPSHRRSSGSHNSPTPWPNVFGKATRGYVKGFTCANVAVKQAYRSGGRGRRLWGYARSRSPGTASQAAVLAQQPEMASWLDSSASTCGSTAPAGISRGQAGELSLASAAPQKQHRPKWSGNRSRREAFSTTREVPPATHEAKDMEVINPWIEPAIHVSRRSQSTPGWRSSPTWQVPLQTELAKAGNTDADDWKGMLKEKATYDVGSIKGPTKLEADYSEVNKAYSKGGDNDLDVEYGAEGSEDDIKPVAGRSRVPKQERFQADMLETKGNTGGRTTATGRASHAFQRQAQPPCEPLRFERTDAAGKAERINPFPGALKLRRRARTLGPSERLASMDLDRGTLRSSRRTLPIGSGNDPRVRGSSPFSSDRFRGAGDRSGGWDRRDDRSTSRLRGRSEDWCAFAKRHDDNFAVALSTHFSQRLDRKELRSYRPPNFPSSPHFEPRASEFFERRKLPTWHVPDIGSETPLGTIVGEREAPDDFESDCKAVPEDLEMDPKVCSLPQQTLGHRSFKVSGHEASNRAPSCDSLRGGDSRSTRLRREVRSLLNKISPENEGQILAQLAAVQLEAAEDFKIMAKLIIEKAMSDPFYSEVYARAISKLVLEYNTLPIVPRQGQSSDESDSSGGESLTGPWCPKSSSGFVNFNDAVLNHCRRTFDKVFDKSEIHSHSSEDEEETLKCRDRAQAFMRFLGHLFKVGILRAGTLQRCLDVLLQGVPDWPKSHCPPKTWVECVIEFLTVAGKDLMSRSTQCKQILKSVVERLERLKDFRTSIDLPGTKGESVNVYPSRILFLIQDILEANNKGFPSVPFDSKGGPAKAKCKMPVRLPHHMI